MIDAYSESLRTAVLAESFQGPHERRMMRMISESYGKMRRNDAVKMPQYERGD